MNNVELMMCGNPLSSKLPGGQRQCFDRCKKQYLQKPKKPLDFSVLRTELGMNVRADKCFTNANNNHVFRVALPDSSIIMSREADSFMTK